MTLAQKSDSGQYSCEVINEEGIDIAHTQVFIEGKCSLLRTQVQFTRAAGNVGPFFSCRKKIF